jgi:hypothetical protein
LIVQSGEAFLTEAIITSPTEAYLLLEPPRTFIHKNSLAQVLSADTNLDSVCIINN